MQGAYGGLVCIIMYAGNKTAEEEDFSLITNNNLFILTNLSQEILAIEGA